jgi:hypothetical protein
VLALLVFLPFAAMPGFILQSTGWPTLLKDVLFVVPAYLGAVAMALRGRLGWGVPADVTFALVAYILVILAQSVQVVLLSPLIAALGLKLWLFYIPLLPLAAQLFDRHEQVVRWLRALVVIALVPSLLGIMQALLVAVGLSQIAYLLYGNLAAAATQNFVQIGATNDLTLARIPSTFAFVTQYYNYLLIMLPLGVAVWLGDPSWRWRWFGAAATLILFFAGVTTGARGFLAWGPAEIATFFLFSRRVPWAAILVLGTGVVAALYVFSAVIGEAAGGILALAEDYLFVTSLDQMNLAIDAGGWLGNGPGLQTGAIRYVLDNLSVDVPQVGVEVWYAKALYEIGLPGLIAGMALWIVLLVALWRVRSHVLDRSSSTLATAIFVIVGGAIVNLVKGSSIEFDPLNVYFWFLPGLAFALPRLSRQFDDAATQRARMNGVVASDLRLDAPS